MKVRSIRSKVLIAITGITLLTAAAMAFVFYGRSSRMIEENYITVLSQRTRLLTDTVDDMLKMYAISISKHPVTKRSKRNWNNI